jgi:protein-L-isoaspartate O-methyltransferase
VVTDYNAIAHAYRDPKRLPIKQYSEAITLFQTLGSVHDLAVLDVACGEGYYAQAMAVYA